ncbi:hypothetical protein FY046_01680 [Erwinia sp. 1181_3]|uniref:hypothetical protein n=1 Tax=Erwinia sp. 1181_3 TaxID=2605957 RepID=UPI004058373D
MAKNNSIKITIDGDAKPLQTALDSGAKSVDDFGKSTGGVVGDVASKFSGGMSKAGMAVTGLAGAVGIAGLAIAGTFTAVQNRAERAFEVFQNASLSQMGITQVQKMANMYASVGLTMEQIADHQKDIKDRIGDALTNQAGSMYTDVIQPLKLNILELQKMADAGDDVYAKIYFAAKSQGLSTSQMVNMFETMGNDAAKRLTVLKDFNNEQDYQNTLAGQSVQLTEQQSDQFAEYRKSTLALSNAWESWNNAALAPVAERLAGILDLITQILNSKPVAGAATAASQQGIDLVKQYQQESQQEFLSNSSIYGKQIVDQQKADQKAFQDNISSSIDMATKMQDDIKTLNKQYNEGIDKSTITASMKTFQTEKQKTQAKIDALDVQYKQTKEAIEKSVVRAYGNDQNKMQKDLDTLTQGYKSNREDLVKKLTADEDKASEKRSKTAEAEAKKAEALNKKIASDRLTAQASLNKAISDMTIGSNARQLAEFDRQQMELVNSIKKSAKTLGLSDDKLSGLLNDQLASGAAKRLDMTNSMIGYSDPNQGIKDTNSLIASGNLNDGQKSFLANQQNQRISGDNPFSSAASDQQALDQQNNTAAMNAELAQNDLLLKGHEDYEKRKAEITAKYNAQAITISNQNSQAQLQIFSDAATSLTAGMTAAFGESSGAAQAAFAISKGITMAQTILSIQSALAQALATPFPASLAAYAKVATLGMSIISTAKGASSGQFHGGVDELPSSYDNKSFILKAGERVVQPAANKKLTAFLDKQNSGQSTAGDITVNAPLIIQGDIAGDDAKFNEMLKKHSNSVTQALRSSQKRNS